MSAVDDLLIALSSYHGGYRLMRRRARGYTGYTKQERERYGIGERDRDRDHSTDLNVERVMLSRLKEKGFVTNEQRGIWKLTAHGFEHAKKILAGRQNAIHINKERPNLIVAFDIPEVDAGKRQWLRLKLRWHGFRMLQKSVWFGPGPLPESFVDELRTLRVLSHMKFFSAQEADIV